MEIKMLPREICHFCGFETNESDYFCSRCGAEIGYGKEKLEYNDLIMNRLNLEDQLEDMYYSNMKFKRNKITQLNKQIHNIQKKIEKFYDLD